MNFIPNVLDIDISIVLMSYTIVYPIFPRNELAHMSKSGETDAILKQQLQDT